MPDRSPRLQPRLSLSVPSVPGGVRDTLLRRERPTSPTDTPKQNKGNEGARRNEGDQNEGEQRNEGATEGAKPSGAEDDNPFAPPPEGTPDRPWQPRRPAGEDAPEGGGGRPPWGNQWSDQQPGRSQDGGFGERPGRGPEGPGPGQGGGTPRWDPTDPAQRKARYALLCGMWAFFFALFGWPYVALLLGALALNWGIGALRTKMRTPDPDSPPPAEPTGRPQTTAAISGIVTASLALILVAVTFTAQLVYRDYYTCTKDALTNEAQQSCDSLLPKELRGVLGVNT